MHASGIIEDLRKDSDYYGGGWASAERMEEVITIQVDWLYEDSLAAHKERLARWTGSYPVIAKVVVDHGPGGGWPVVEITGRRRQVRGFLLAEYLGGNLDDMNGMVGWVLDWDAPAR